MKTKLTSLVSSLIGAGVGLVIILFTIGFIQGFVNGVKGHSRQSTTTSDISAPLTQDPTLVADAQQLGINYAPLNWAFVPYISTPSDESVGGTIIGIYNEPNTIHIVSGLDKTDELNIVAYEYLHYAYDQIPASQQQSLSTELTAYRSQNSDFNTEVSEYQSDDPSIIDSEMFSNACTRVDPSLLSDDFNNYCNQFITNRSILFE